MTVVAVISPRICCLLKIEGKNNAIHRGAHSQRTWGCTMSGTDFCTMFF